MPTFAEPAAALAAGHVLHDGAAPVAIDDVVVRVLLLTATAILAGLGLLAPLSRPPTTARRVLIGTSGGAVIALALPALDSTDIHLGALVAHLALVVLLAWTLAVVPGADVRPRAALATGAATTGLLCAEATAETVAGIQALAAGHVVGATALLGSAMVVVTSRPLPHGVAARRLWVVASGAGLLLLCTGVIRMQLARIDLDAQLYRTDYGLALSTKIGLTGVLIGLGLVLWWLRRTGRPGAEAALVRLGAVSIVVALVAGTALAALPEPIPRPEPGVPLLRRVPVAGDRIPILVTPHRPGRNLVHVGGDRPTRVRVGTTTTRLRPTRRVDGASGAWAQVDLPPGRSTLLVEHGGRTSTVTVDTGNGTRAIGSATGPDGPECAGVALARHLAEANRPLTRCPADALSSSDREALEAMVDGLAARRIGSVDLVSDGSPRGRSAEQVVRAALTANAIGIARASRADALVVVGGWSTAFRELSGVGARQAETPTYTHGIYLAPWLLTPTVAASVPNVLAPLRFDPHDRLPAMYAARIGLLFPSAMPSPAGYRAWLAAQPQGDTELDETVPQLYTASLAAYLPKEFAHHTVEHGWFPGGTVVPVSGPLPRPDG